jgi:hypothetical protein
MAGTLRSWRKPVPEGQVTIAQGFNLGCGRLRGLVPQGRLRHSRTERSQSSLRDSAPSSRGPRVETLGYCHPSLRDEAV